MTDIEEMVVVRIANGEALVEEWHGPDDITYHLTHPERDADVIPVAVIMQLRRQKLITNHNHAGDKYDAWILGPEGLKHTGAELLLHFGARHILTVAWRTDRCPASFQAYAQSIDKGRDGMHQVTWFTMDGDDCAIDHQDLHEVCCAALDHFHDPAQGWV